MFKNRRDRPRELHAGRSSGADHHPFRPQLENEGAFMAVKALGAYAADKPLEPLAIERRAPGVHDVQIDIAYCGVCHSDLHQVRAEWGGTIYPCVPGHEIVGRVSAVGEQVTRFQVGDLVGVGCMVDSCQHCPSCSEGLEQYCENGFTGTYNFPTPDAPGHTLGGYSQRIVVDDKFVLKVTHAEDRLAAVAPLLCAGITTYSPLRHWNVGPGKKVGIVGIGGLGHMGVKLAHAMGAHVVAFTTSESKREDARALGADEVVVSRNPDEMAAHANSFDFILDTVAASHSLDAFTTLLKRDGTLTLVGVPEHAHPSPDVSALIFKRRAIAGSLIGGIAETQEMLDFCAEHDIVADIEMIAGRAIDEAYDRMQRSDVKYRFVIDIATLEG
jgi:alcohol dehydrogenase (NADP+)